MLMKGSRVHGDGVCEVRFGGHVGVGRWDDGCRRIVGESSVLFTCSRVRALRLLLCWRYPHRDENYVGYMSRSWRGATDGTVAVEEAVLPCLVDKPEVPEWALSELR